jgi:hypothetical protein
MNNANNRRELTQRLYDAFADVYGFVPATMVGELASDVCDQVEEFQGMYRRWLARESVTRNGFAWDVVAQAIHEFDHPHHLSGAA